MSDWQEQPTDSPVRWVAQHIRRYDQSGGTRGHRWSGVDTLLLTTRGRKTGKARRTALIYGRDGDDLVVVASNGGKPHHPAWYLNLRNSPDVFVQVGPERFTARAHTVTGQERQRLWELMSTIWPDYERYANRALRQIPVVAISRSTPAD